MKIYKLKAIATTNKIVLKDLYSKLECEKSLINECLIVQSGTDSFLFVFPFGAVVLCNTEEVEILGSTFSDNLVYSNLDTFDIIVGGKKFDCTSSAYWMSKFDLNKVRVMALVLAHSAVLTGYDNELEKALEEAKPYVETLKEKGEVYKGRKAILKFTGKLLSIRREILSNLYVIDTPEDIRNKAALYETYCNFKQILATSTRYRAIELKLDAVKELLEILSSIVSTKHSMALEAVIIVLITTEILLSFLH